MENVTPLARWAITLTDGTTIEIWSDGYSHVGDDIVFGALVDATPEEQADLHVTSRTPTDARRVGIAVARVPRSIVATVESM